MQCSRPAGYGGRIAFVAACTFLAPACGSYIRRSAAAPLHAETPQPHLQGAVLEPWQRAVQESLSVNFWQLMPKTPKSVEMAKEPQRNSTSAQVGEGKTAEKQGQGQPVAMQVSQEELDKIAARLSPSCEARFDAILEGKGPQLHDFGGPRGGDATQAGCQRLNGSLCATRASIVQSRDAPNGRKIRSTLEAEGQGCLPSDCLDGRDLEVLAGFMQLKAKELVPGTAVRVELHVDCKQSGGSVASVGTGAEEIAPKPEHEAKDEKVVDPQSINLRSRAVPTSH
mmetsp:Transcript_44218/g.137722  ORF Transcript_44218/g.137722 Transcript_44218/m.137722 type:complete len:283 (-) Transcript_44218:133-981(-)